MVIGACRVWHMGVQRMVWDHNDMTLARGAQVAPELCYDTLVLLPPNPVRSMVVTSAGRAVCSPYELYVLSIPPLAVPYAR